MIRDSYGKPVYVVSGARCEKHNKAVGGAPKSLHVRGEAADLARTKDLLEFLKPRMVLWGFSMEDPDYTPTWLHVDLRSDWRFFKP